MKSARLWIACVKDAGDICHVRTSRDIAYAMSRYENEGEEFFTLTLPKFEKDFLKSLSLGRIASGLFVGFRRRGGLPAFLSGFLQRIFAVDGYILDEPDYLAIRCVRQITLLLSKVESLASESRNKAALDGYIQCDQSVSYEIPDSVFDNIVVKEILPFLSAVERRLEDGLPANHATGALGTRESYNSRFQFYTWTERLHRIYPWWEDMGLSISEAHGDEVVLLSPEQEHPVRVSLVPKTQKAPRVIAMEPVYNQFVQQGIYRAMSEELPRHNRLWRSMCWESQDFNRKLARIGSANGSLATLDLSEASDRVSATLVWHMLKYTPLLREGVFASRSRFAQMPSGEVIPLKKFASMGSTLCFPFESLVFYALVRYAEVLSGYDRRDFSGNTLRIYGDDIIVPTPVVRSVVQTLERFGLRVNDSKSFYTGRFRESCGSDWYDGHDVSVFRLRRKPPEHRRHLDEIRSTINFHQSAFLAGYGRTAEEAKRFCTPFLPAVIEVLPHLNVPAFYSWDAEMGVRTHPSYQSMQVKGYVFKETKPLDPLDGYGALRKFFLNRGEFPRDKDHLRRDGRSQCVGITTGWHAPTER